MKTSVLPLLLVVLLSSCVTEQRNLAPLGLVDVNKTALEKDAPEAKANAVHSKPVKPHFIAVDRYEMIAKDLPTFPPAGSIEQRADELNLLSLQEVRTKADCARAASEVKGSLETFFGEPQGPLTANQVERLTPFFEQIRSDASYFVQKLKTDRARKRPFQYIKGLEPCVVRELTPAYPSGHATVSRLYALILSDLFPTKTKQLLKRSDQIAEDRVIAGMHHRSDIIAGQALGERLYKELSKSKEFKKELAELERTPTKVAR